MESAVKFLKTSVGAGCLTLALGGPGLFAAATASAAGSNGSGTDKTVSTTPPAMNIATSADEQIRTTGIQGVFAGADQCTDLSSIKLECVSQSSEATPQFKSPNKMTK